MSRTVDAGPGPERAGRTAVALGGLLLVVALLGAGPALAAPVVPAPTGLTATAVSPTRVDLSWSPVKKATGYRVLRSTTSGGPYTPLASTTGPGHVDTSVAAATRYFYVVTASQGGRTSGFSTQASATTPAATPAPPTGLTATAASSSAIDLAWQPSPGATGYTVHRALGDYPQVGSVGSTTTTFRDAGLTASTTYSYVVRAANTAGLSPDSNVASATTAPPPAPPVTPADLQASPDNAGIYLTWAPSGGASGYQVLRATTTGGPYGLIATTGTAVSHADFPPQQGVTFFYVVRALGGGGTSGNSNEVAAMTAPPTPTDFAAEAVAAGPTAGLHVALSWTAAPGAASYMLERATVGTGYEPLARVTEGTSHGDFTVSPSTIYYYRLTAVNDSGWSKYVEVATTTP